jgi:hypothetical protein
MEALKALEVIEKLESDLCTLYEALQKTFEKDKELSDLFSLLGAEERNHANMARMQKNIVRAKPADFGEVSLNFTEIRQMMDSIEVVRAIPRNRVSDILLQCYLIESSLVEQYVVTALWESNEEIKQLLKMLSQGFRDHLGMLASRVQASGGDITNLETIRRHPRVSYAGKIMINEKIFATGIDISESGMFLLTATPFPDGSIVNVSFPVSGGIVTVAGTVAYSVPSAGFSLAFRELVDKNRTLIRNYVDDALRRVDRVTPPA